jgi:Tfp pilus assembly protein PilV
MIFRVKHCAAFSLVEVALALGVMSFCLIALFGLLPIGVTSNQTAVEQTMAGSIATSIAADLFATPRTRGTSTCYGFNVASATNVTQTIFFGEDANPTGAIGASASSNPRASRYRAVVGFYPAGQQKATAVRILVTWPAFADSSGSGWPKNFSGSFETTIALDRQ